MQHGEVRHEFDACVIKEWGTRRIFFRGLLLGGDPRTSLFLVQVQQKLETLLGPVQFEVLRYPSGCEAQGDWIGKRQPEQAKVCFACEDKGWAYWVKDQGELVACMVIIPGIRLEWAIIYTLLDGEDNTPYCPKSCQFPPYWPEGFPDQTKHPGGLG